MKIVLTCFKCGKKVYTDEEGVKSRMRFTEYKDEEEFKENFLCQVCKSQSKKK